MFIYAGLIAAIGLGNRLYAAARWRLAASDVEGKGYSPSALSRVYTSYRKHLGVPAIGKNHNELWGWVSVPTRLQSLLVGR
jgi:hypothetical protein